MTATLAPAPARHDLTAAGAVLLVSCYELGHQPLHIASPLAQLHGAGFAPAVADTAVDELAVDAVERAALVAIAVPMHTALRLGVRVAARVREINPAARVCFYGLYATLNAGYLHRGLADFVIGGEYEEALVDLARALAAGDDPSTVAGVGTADRPAAPVLKRLPLLPPERATLPALRRYAGLERDGAIVRAGYVEATRGCHHTCGHCPITPIYGGRFFAIPREVVIADARAQIAAGARHLTFGDPDFFNGPTHGLRILRALKAEYPPLSFDVTIKIEHLIQHRALVPELAELGCAFVVSAVESLSDTVLAKLSKGHTAADVATALAILDEVALPMRPSLLPFTPWTTMEDYLHLLAFVAAHDLLHHVDPVHFSIRLLVPPGSALLADLTSADWLGPLDEDAFTFRWAAPDPRLDDLQRTVAAIAEEAAGASEDAAATFARIWRAAHAAAGERLPPLPVPRDRRGKPPRLTESWFC